MKIINFFIPFLLEMLFGKKDDKVVLSRKDVWKRRIVYAVMVISFGANYIFVGKLYNLGAAYIALKRKADAWEIIASSADADKATVVQLKESLTFCMRIAYATPTVPSGKKPPVPDELKKQLQPPAPAASKPLGK